MLSITVRRQQANESRTRSDFVVSAETPSQLERQLRAVLSVAQQERNTGIWSDADPEVWVGEAFVGRLAPGANVGMLTKSAIERLEMRDTRERTH